jgi:hypothetical protein
MEMEDKSHYEDDHTGGKIGTSAECRDQYLDLRI